MLRARALRVSLLHVPHSEGESALVLGKASESIFSPLESDLGYKANQIQSAVYFPEIHYLFAGLRPHYSMRS